jgi:hypothetical protein
MWLKLGAIAVATVVILFALFAPMVSIDVRLDMPRGTDNATASSVTHGFIWATNAISAVVFVAILALSAWLSWRVLKHHRA